MKFANERIAEKSHNFGPEKPRGNSAFAIQRIPQKKKSKKIKIEQIINLHVTKSIALGRKKRRNQQKRGDKMCYHLQANNKTAATERKKMEDEFAE